MLVAVPASTSKSRIYMSMQRFRIPAQLPGDFSDMDQIVEFYRKAKFAQGYQFNVAVGENTFQNMTFPGTARMLLGFTLIDTSRDPLNLFTLNLNGENIIEDASWVEYTKVLQNPVAVATLVTGSSFKEEYYEYLRPLGGNDKVKIRYTAATAGKLLCLFRFVSDPSAVSQ